MKPKNQLLLSIWISSARKHRIKGVMQKVFVFYGERKSSRVELRENFPVLLYLLEIFYSLATVGAMDAW